MTRPNYVRIIASDVLSRNLVLFLIISVAYAFAKAHGNALQVVLMIAGGVGAIVVVRVVSIASLSGQGVPVIARIVTVDPRTSFLGGGSGRSAYSRDPDEHSPDYALVTVRYYFNGREYDSSRGVERWFARDFTPGADVEILVDPKKPYRFVFAHLA